MDDLKKLISSIPGYNERQAFYAGYKSVKDGANATNCHFAFFSTKELSDAWSRGVKRAKEDLGIDN